MTDFAAIFQHLIISPDQMMQLVRDTWETLYMTSMSTALSLLMGFFWAIALIMTGPKGLNPNLPVYRALDVVVNLLRSFPFIILLIAIIPLTRLLVGTSIGSTATIVPLTIAAAPFVARLIEGSLLEVDSGVVEAARSFGATNTQIIFRVMLKEALPSIVLNVAVIAITLLSYSAMAGIVGGGGLGDLAIRYGYHRYQPGMMIYAVLILLIIVQAIQSAGNFFYKVLK